ncbi:MAG TPA: hypothetical protein VGB23_01870 [Nitrospirota bacterium]
MKKKRPGGFSYTLTRKQIKDYQALPIEMRLQWLEEANRFLWEAMPEKNKKIREALRKGEM